MENEKESKMNTQQDLDSDGSFSLTLEEQLENANTSIADLQDYIKKKGMDEIKNNQMQVQTKKLL